MFVQYIKVLASSFAHIRFDYVFREANFVVDAIALGHDMNNVVTWSYCLLMFVYPTFHLDQLDTWVVLEIFPCNFNLFIKRKDLKAL